MAPVENGMKSLVALSRHYGGDAEFALGGGGNTSWKTEEVLHVKASGHSLATIGEDGFVVMDRRALSELMEAPLPTEADAREAAFKDAILKARLRPELGQRPSVECAIHNLLPARFVVHTHSTIVNMVTCCTKGETLARELWGEDVLWVPYVDPGVTLAREIAGRLKEYNRATGRSCPAAVVLANHGLIVCGESEEEIHATTDRLVDAVAKKIGVVKSARAERRGELLEIVAPLLRGALEDSGRLPILHLEHDAMVQAFMALDGWSGLSLHGPMTPDQIVYCGSYPLVVKGIVDADEDEWREEIVRGVKDHVARHGEKPRVAVVEGLGVFGAGRTIKDAQTVSAVYRDAMRIMHGARELGGVSYLTDAQRQFIEAWEVEAYRKSISLSGAGGGRMAGKVAVVTGAAQGFGLEIARGLVEDGACVLLADINVDGASAAAQEMNATGGSSVALGAAMNVTDGATVHAALQEALAMWGGVDLFVANAGVLRAGSVKTLAEKDFDFVTSVNYKGYFVCVQVASPIMARQHATAPCCFTDIVQINSKSGLAGSNKNGAYAGAKFGGIGLMQSFAMELVEDGIKVNSVCPGNFFDGPLWSDPENGLFVQYLRTGKVPGAKSIADVKKFYEAKVPMGRGCESRDVLRAILYLVEQQYETGQALPVTGGQIMLH